eukprot:10218485-Karenia_brevis.AAC.1
MLKSVSLRTGSKNLVEWKFEDCNRYLAKNGAQLQSSDNRCFMTNNARVPAVILELQAEKQWKQW